MNRSNPALRTHRDEILNRIVSRLERDERVLAAWLSGSTGRGTDDDWSDIDLHISVRDEDYVTWLTGRATLYREVGAPVLIQEEQPSETGVYQLVLFAGPVFLDLVVHPKSHAVLDVDERLVFERSGLPMFETPSLAEDERRTRLRHQLDFFWLMTPIALKYLARGRTHRAVTQLDLLAGSFINVWRLLYRPQRREAGGPHWLHPEHDAELIAIIPRLAEHIDPGKVFDAITRLMASMRALEERLEALGIPIPSDAIDEIVAFHKMVGQRISNEQ
jgi:predicted nucleotidyltransferase